MAKTELELKKESKEKIASLRLQKRNIDKEIKSLAEAVDDNSKLEEWKMIHEYKKEIIGVLRKQNISWKKFIDTPDWFDYAYYSQVGKVKRLKTSISLPPPAETRTDEATMIKLAKDQQSKIIRRKKKRTWKTKVIASISKKTEVQKSGGVI